MSVSPPVRIALAQLNACVGDLAGNAAAIVEATQQASAAGAQLVLFAEMALTGYPIEDLALRGSFQRAAREALDDLAAGLAVAGLGEVSVIVGALGLSDGGRPQNIAAHLRAGTVQEHYAKVALPNYGVFDEYRIFEAGAERRVIEVGNARLLLAICEDIWQPVTPEVVAAADGIDGIVVLNGSPFEVGKAPSRLAHAAHWAGALQAPLAYVNLVGAQDDLVFDGGSFVCEPDGSVTARAGQFAEEILFTEFPVGADRPAPSERLSLLLVGDPGVVVDGDAAAWETLDQLADDDAPDDQVPPGVAPVAEAGFTRASLDAEALGSEKDRTSQIYQALVIGVRDYCVKNGFRSVVLGLSGGIDSALCATIASDAIGAANVVGVSMPSEYSSQHSKDDAAQLAANLGLDYRIQPIAPLFTAFQTQLSLTGVSAENLQARLRGVILMGLSNQEGHLVLAPGNKSELATGYSTIYGDAVGGFAPIKDVLKTQVWQLARWRNEQARELGQVPPIPDSSIDKAPSAELRPGQQDSDSLPEYDILDHVLEAYVGAALGRHELLALGFDEPTVDLVLRLVDRAEWKRRQYPPGPKVSALAFGRDRRLPISTRWREP